VRELEVAVGVYEAGEQDAVAEVVDGTFGAAGIATPTDPDDAATRNGDEAIPDRGAGDREKPARTE
jgi:hypothetical protein